MEQAQDSRVMKALIFCLVFSMEAKPFVILPADSYNSLLEGGLIHNPDSVYLAYSNCFYIDLSAGNILTAKALDLLASSSVMEKVNSFLSAASAPVSVQRLESGLSLLLEGVSLEELPELLVHNNEVVRKLSKSIFLRKKVQSEFVFGKLYILQVTKAFILAAVYILQVTGAFILTVAEWLNRRAQDLKRRLDIDRIR